MGSVKTRRHLSFKKGGVFLESKKRRPATTPEGRQNQLISLAIDLAEEKLRDGTASSQVIVHFLNLATQQAKLETEKLALENKLVKAKTEALESEKDKVELYEQAIRAMKMYNGEATDE